MVKKNIPLISLLFTFFLLSACGQVSSECKKIAFAMSDFGAGVNPDIYSVCPDGSHLTQLTRDPAYDASPAWSPDGAKIAFASSRAGESHVFVMNADGSDPSQLTFDFVNDLPVWLPNGSQIAFRTLDPNGLWWWRIINIENNEISQFTEPSYDFFSQTPAWSPDGQEIAYMSMVEQQQRNDGSSQIHVKKVDGSKDVALTSDIWANINPVYSPDGSKIAFLSEREGTYNKFALFVMDKDGKNVRKLTESIYFFTARFTWSPDNMQIAISDAPEIGNNIYILNLGARKMRKLLDLQDGEAAFAPAW